MPRAVPKVLVTFDLDANGLLNVSASESSGVSKEITINNDGGRLSKEQVEKMIADAAKFKAEDEKVMMANKVKNRLSGFIGHIGRVLKDKKYEGALEKKDKDTLSKAGRDAIGWYKANSKT